MNNTLKNQIEKTLALAISEFKNEDETLKFLREFLTAKELEILSKRLSIAYWLSKKRTNENIKTNLKVTNTAILDAKKLLQKSEIKNIMRRIDADVWSDKWSQKIKGLLKKKAL
ncbi:hypothetical protein BH10PAT1_BH10PAT1_2100 [soil metagenome]